jgi:hypothetical protein
MRVLGAALVLLGAAGTAFGLHAATARRRPADLAGALLAPIALLIAIAGAVTLFVPGFLR